MRRSGVIENIEAMRARRVRPERPDWSIMQGALQEVRRTIRAQATDESRTLQAWRQLVTEGAVPERLAAAVEVGFHPPGTVRLRARDAATLYELSRMMRAGGRSRFIRLCPTSITSVRVSL